MDAIQPSIEIVGFVILFLLCAYSLRLISYLRYGMMEKGWRYIAYGAILFFLAEIAYVLSPFTPNVGDFTAENIGSVLDTLGGLFLFLGVRAHLLVWKIPKHQVQQKMIEP